MLERQLGITDIAQQIEGQDEVKAARQRWGQVKDGPGNPAPPALTGGQGLAGMRERVAVFGGDLRAGPRPGGGFTVCARLPIGESS